jgi:hypothetical protein
LRTGRATGVPLRGAALCIGPRAEDAAGLLQRSEFLRVSIDVSVQSRSWAALRAEARHLVYCGVDALHGAAVTCPPRDSHRAQVPGRSRCRIDKDVRGQPVTHRDRPRGPAPPPARHVAPRLQPWHQRINPWLRRSRDPAPGRRRTGSGRGVRASGLGETISSGMIGSTGESADCASAACNIRACGCSSLRKPPVLRGGANYLPTHVLGAAYTLAPDGARPFGARSGGTERGAGWSRAGPSGRTPNP